MDLTKATRAELEEELKKLNEEYEGYKAQGLKLDMSRGKPGADQLNACEGMLTVVKTSEDTVYQGLDTRNYGTLEGIPACRQMFADLLEVPVEQVLAGGNSSLTFMYDTMDRLMVFGAAGVDEPWLKKDKVKFLCPVPGYDRHFAICEQFGIEMINIPMDDNGPDMDMVEKLVAEDESIKGIWCVPKFANPSGVVYSDEVVRRFAALQPKARDFRIFWDNAYIIHGITDEDIQIPNIIEECAMAGKPDMVFEFCSTSKISFPGAGVCAFAASPANIAWQKKYMKAQQIGPDKINQLRHVLFFKDASGLKNHMEIHKKMLRPKFDAVINTLEKNLAGTGAGSWTVPKGGYFVSFDAMEGCAKHTQQLCKEAGIVMTGAGATYPYGKDPKDSTLRIAPSYPPIEELQLAMEVFCVCAKKAAVEKLLAQ